MNDINCPVGKRLGSRLSEQLECIYSYGREAEGTLSL